MYINVFSFKNVFYNILFNYIYFIYNFQKSCIIPIYVNIWCINYCESEYLYKVAYLPPNFNNS